MVEAFTQLGMIPNVRVLYSSGAMGDWERVNERRYINLVNIQIFRPYRG